MSKYLSVHFVLLVILFFPVPTESASYRIIFVVIAISLVSALRIFVVLKYSAFFLFTLPLIGIAFSGMLIGALNDISSFQIDYFRDILYTSNFIVVYLLGAWFAYRQVDVGKLSLLLIVFAIIQGVSSIIALPTLIELSGASFNEIVEEAVVPSAVIPYVLGILLYRNYYSSYLNFESASLRIPLIALFSVSIVASFSRTTYIIAVIIILFMGRLPAKFSAKNIFIFAVVIAALVVSLYIGKQSLEYNIFYKMTVIFDEIFTTRFDSYSDISNNWRGYEANQALIMHESADFFQKLFGHGYGAKIPLGITMELAGAQYFEVAVIHNGYAYLLVKVGLLGLFLYLIFFYRILSTGYKFAKKGTSSQQNFSWILMGMALSAMAQTLVVGGPIQGGSAFEIFLIGYFVFSLTRRGRK